ncbi:MAG: CoA ester lyase [Pseudomonadota bacterium]
MDKLSRPWRSVLYIPGDKPRALDKARGLPTDAIIFDLEDAVAPDAKDAARASLGQALAQGGYGPRAGMVRINDLGSPWGRADLNALSSARPEAILLPKVETAEDVAALAALMDGSAGFSDTAIWVMMETPAAILNAGAIASAPRVAGMVMGTNDLAKDLRCQVNATRSALQMTLQTCVVAARAAGIVAVDGVYNAFRDDAGLTAECAQGRALGFDGKSLIHPAQLAISNAAFAPSADEIDLSRRQIEAFEEAQTAGQGVAVLDGRIVEALHVQTARRIIAQSEAIAALEA